MIKAVLFDYNGVIVNDLKLHIKAYTETGKKNGLNITEREVIENFGKGSYRLWKYLLKGKKTLKPMKELAEEKIKKYISLTKKERKKIISPGLNELMKFLKKEKIKTAIISHSDSKQIKAVLSKNILKKFDLILTEEEIRKLKAYKPKPDALLLAAKKLKIKPQECVYVGDMLVDVKAARNAKMKPVLMKSIFVSKKEAEKIKVKRINSLVELKELIKQKLI